jgi:endonuclease/exonuclease/phosphatase family metal-dependent hydrolase
MRSKRGNLFVSITVTLIIIILVSWLFSAGFNLLKPKKYVSYTTVRVASWNLENFGDTKAGKPNIMKGYTDTISKFDIIFVEEIKDEDGTAFKGLCSMLSNYDCLITHRFGMTSSKEQFGIITKKDIQTPFVKDNYNFQNIFERPPVFVRYNISGENLEFYIVHLKPSNVSEEMTNLQKVVFDKGNTVLIGDFNAGCDYYDNTKEKQFDNWLWLIGDDEDTTTTSTNCAYDRIIVTKQAQISIIKYGIWKEGVSSEISNHYPIWLEIGLKQK